MSAELREESSSSKQERQNRSTPVERISVDGTPSVLLNNSYEFELAKKKKQ